MIYALILLAGILYFFVALPGLWLLDHYGGNAGHLVIVILQLAFWVIVPLQIIRFLWRTGVAIAGRIRHATHHDRAGSH